MTPTPGTCLSCGKPIAHPKAVWCGPACRAVLLQLTKDLLRVYCDLARERCDRLTAERAKLAA